MNFNQTILAGAIGGLITSILLPLTYYFVLRILHKCLTSIKLDEREESDYRVFNIRVRNCSLATFKNIIVHVSIDNHKNDIIQKSRILIYCSDAKVERGMLSWSKVVDNKNFAQIDLNQGEEQDINFIRYHLNDPDDAIEIASEQGFYDKDLNNKSRTVLKANRDYSLTIKLTGENFWPKQKVFKFINSEKKLTIK